MIRDTGFVVVGKDNCPWCDRVKDLLSAFGHPYEYINLSTHENADAIVEDMVAKGLKTVPQVYHNGTRVGGFEVTQEYVRGLE
jgi:glutaredoxin